MLVQATKIQTNHVILSSPSALTEISEISPAAFSWAMSSVRKLHGPFSFCKSRRRSRVDSLVLGLLEIVRTASVAEGPGHVGCGVGGKTQEEDTGHSGRFLRASSLGQGAGRDHASAWK